MTKKPFWVVLYEYEGEWHVSGPFTSRESANDVRKALLMAQSHGDVFVRRVMIPEKAASQRARKGWESRRQNEAARCQNEAELQDSMKSTSRGGKGDEQSHLRPHART